jgi:hypothetical protein
VYRFKNYIACLLLLLFVRVMAPEAAILQWHAHEHTEEEPGTTTGFAIGKKHTHCHTDDLFNAPFAPTQIAPVKAVLIPFTDTYSVHHSFVWKFTFPNNTDLRGPPRV